MTAPLLFNRTIAALAAQQVRNMPSRAQVLIRTGVSNGEGGYTYTWAPEANRLYPCRLNPLSVEERQAAQQTTPGAEWLLELPAGSQVTSDRRVEVSGRDQNGTAWVVLLAIVGVKGPRSVETVRELLCSTADPTNPGE